MTRQVCRPARAAPGFRPSFNRDFGEQVAGQQIDRYRVMVGIERVGSCPAHRARRPGSIGV
jgi:hypothetical protein